MKLKIFNFTKNNVDRMLNYNKPIKRSIEIPNNTFVQEKITVDTKLVKITDLILKRLLVIEEKNNTMYFRQRHK